MNAAPALPRRAAADRVIDRLQRQSAARSSVLSLAGGLPAQELFPRVAITRACLATLGANDCAALQYGWPEGGERLRDWIAARLRARGAEVVADDVIVTSGAQQAIALAVDALLSPGDKIRVDAESYPSALDLFRARGLELTPSLDAGAAYVMPGVGNPSGTGLDEAERLRLLRAGLPLIVDEAYAELRFDGRPAPLLLAAARDRVFHVGTFSKTLCPGFRIGWLVPPRAQRERVLRLKSDADLQANSLSQAIVTETLETWDYDAHLARVRKVYERRAERLFAGVRARFPNFRVVRPEGGFSVFVTTDLTGDDTRLLKLAIAAGVSLDPGRLFHREGATRRLSFRLCHSNLSLRAIDEALRRLARAVRSFARS